MLNTTPGNPTDWWSALLTPYTKTQTWNKLAFKASEWVDCACGTQSELIPRYSEEEARYMGTVAEGAPKNQELFNLGCKFYGHVKDAFRGSMGQGDPELFLEDVNQAAFTLYQIEVRSAEILAELTDVYP